MDPVIRNILEQQLAAMDQALANLDSQAANLAAQMADNESARAVTTAKRDKIEQALAAAE